MSRERKTNPKPARAPQSQSEPARKPVKAKEAPSVGDFLRRQRELANLSLRKLSERSGVSAAVLREIEGGLRHPSRTLVSSLAAALRLSAETLYLQAGVLDPKDVEEADAVREILRDPHLTDRQRETLVEIYSAFRLVNKSTDDGNE